MIVFDDKKGFVAEWDDNGKEIVRHALAIPKPLSSSTGLGSAPAGTSSTSMHLPGSADHYPTS